MAFQRIEAKDTAEVLNRLGWGEPSDVPFLLVEDGANAAAGLRIHGESSTDAKLLLHFPPPGTGMYSAVTAVLAWACETYLACVTCTVEELAMSAQLSASGMSLIYCYDVWRIEVVRLQERLEPLYRLAKSELSRSGFHAAYCQPQHIAEIQAVVAAHELLSAELVQFSDAGYDGRCSAVVLAGSTVAGVVLTKVEGDTAVEITRAVSPKYLRQSGPINLLLIMHFTQALLAGGQRFATFVANTHSASETVNMAKRCGGELLARQFVHRWEIDES